jgi:hypothetical protein
MSYSVHLYAERGSPKFEPAARRWLVRYLSEGTPSVSRTAAPPTAIVASKKTPHERGFRVRAGDRARTGDIQLGRLALYQLSYTRVRLA